MYNPHDHFELKKLSDAPDSGWGGWFQPDGEYDFRATVSYVGELNGRKVAVESLFPPVQLHTTDNKYDFTRHLGMYLDSIKAHHHVINVTVKQGDTVMYSFQP